MMCQTPGKVRIAPPMKNIQFENLHVFSVARIEIQKQI